jgi:phage terminase small subunit
MGRPPKPTRLKVLQGNPGKRSLPKNEPKPAAGAAPPPWMSPAARKEWARLAPRLLKLGLLTELDAEALAILCGHLACAGQLSSQGLPIDPRVSSEIRQLMGRFGMTPADRSKVSAVPEAAPADPFEDWAKARVVRGGKES